MSIIDTLPIELWNIILINSDNIGAKNFMYVVILHKLFRPEELRDLSVNYSYDYIIKSSPINYYIYKIFNNLEAIDTKIKYITYYNKLFEMISTINRDYINIKESIMLREYLTTKIKNEKEKNKFENLTNTILFNYCSKENRSFNKMITLL
jgi:hypothetical protein